MPIHSTCDDRPARVEVRLEFDDLILPQMDAGRRLAKWLVPNQADADDVVQEASLRAFRYFATFIGGNARAWFLRIVRNTSAGWHSRRLSSPIDEFDEECHSHVDPSPTPETLLLQTDDAMLIEEAMSRLSERARRLLILREGEGLSYRELADAMRHPDPLVDIYRLRALVSRQALARRPARRS